MIHHDGCALIRSLDFEELERAVADAKGKGIEVRAMVFINPGNPTGKAAATTVDYYYYFY